MIIGIDASKAGRKNRTGIENYVYELILHLKKIDKNNVYFLFTNIHLPKELTNSVNFIEKYTTFKRLWNRFFLPLAVSNSKPDVYLQPTDSMPWSAPRKSISVIHDLAYKYFPNAYSTGDKIRQLKALQSAANSALKIICVSDATKKDLLKFYPKAKTKVIVTPLGFNKQSFHPFDNPRDLLRIGEKYILFTGRLEERKNVVRLIRAFLILKKSKKMIHKLVLAGAPGFGYDAVYSAISESKEYINDIILPGHIGHDRLPEVIARSDVFAFPTLYEGFGLPALEAMACGASIVTSNNSSLPEVVGDAALLCNPESEQDIADKIRQVISDEKLQRELSKKAIKRSENFSWDQTAKDTLKVLETL